MNIYQDKIAFITGGSTGIGLAIAKALVTAKCQVVIFARTLTKLQTAKDELLALCKHPTSQKINAYSVDTTDMDAVKITFDIAIQENGIPDYFINCVGIAQPDYFENISYHNFDRLIKTNLYSTWNTVHTIVPYMKKKGGAILNTSSVAGFVGVFGYTDYCMTKFGIIGFSEALRQELAPYQITVSVLCPPDTDTPGLEAENATKPPETKAIAGNAKLVQPEMVAAVALKGIAKKQKIIIPGFDGKFTLLMKRFFPRLVDWIMHRSIQSAQIR